MQYNAHEQLMNRLISILTYIEGVTSAFDFVSDRSTEQTLFAEGWEACT